MGKLLQLKKKIDLIDEMTEFYENEQSSVKSKIDNLKYEIDSIFSDRHKNIEEEIEEKKSREEKAIESKYLLKIKECQNRINNQKIGIQKKIDDLTSEQSEAIKEDIAPLEMLIQNKEAIIKKFTDLNITSDARASIKRQDIPLYTREQIIEIIQSGIDTEQYVKDLALRDINLKFIEKDFWFPAGRLDNKVNNSNMVDFLKFMNIIGAVTLVGLYSDFIVTGLLGALWYFGYKNINETRTISQYRDWLYTIYEYEEDFRNNIVDNCKSQFHDEIQDYNSQLISLEAKGKEEENTLRKQMSAEISKLQSEYKNMKEMKVAEINADLTTELQNIKVSASESLKRISETFIGFQKSVLMEKKKIKQEFDELNTYSIDIVNDSTVLNLNRIHLGVEISDDSVNYFDDLPFGSYLFVHNQDKPKMRDLMKYLACQFASKIKGNLLKINILDPLSYGEGLSEIVDEKSISQFFNEQEVSEKIDEILDKFTKDIKDVFTGYDDILEYNEEKNAKGSKPYPYTLNLIQNVNIFDDMARFKQLLQTKKSGVINFILISNDLVDEVEKGLKDSEVKKSEFIDLMSLFSRLFACAGGFDVKTGSTSSEGPYIEEKDELEEINAKMVSDTRDILNNLTGIVDKYDISPLIFNSFNYQNKFLESKEYEDMFTTVDIAPSIFRDWGRDITQNIKNSEMLIFYFEDFVQRVVPPGTEFTKPCIKGLDMHFGYKDGDIEKPIPIPLDGEVIHYFMGGRTGMGKSNTLNTGINTLIRMYSPDDLNIYYMDFKVIEGKKYMRNPTPHFKCISVTEDPYYLISLFDHLIKLLKHRQEVVLPSYNAGKLADIKKKGVKIPEIIIVIDEFTEGLKAEGDAKDTILQSSDTISRLGRASGVHLFYTSQDVSSKIPDGTLGQFAGRLALPVSDAATSKQIIMNASAADADFQEMGNLLYNNKGGDEKYNVKLKVPLIEPEDMNKNFDYVNSLCKGKWELNCVTFDQDEEKSNIELLDFLIKNREKLKEIDKITVGGNAQFSTEDTFVGFDLLHEDSNNVLIISQGKKRRIELTNTVVANIAKTHGESTILFVIRGNKDYLDFNFIDKYKDDFKAVIELESVKDLLNSIENSRLAILERELKEFGVHYDEKSENFEDFQDYTGFIEEWNRVKGITLERCEEELSRGYISALIEAMRPYSNKALIVGEGVDELYGIGVDNYSTGEKVPILRYAPYYNMINVWNTSKIPKGFTPFEAAFRHRLIGSLNPTDMMEYRFMKDTQNSYGGYINIINPNAPFKFKIFKIDDVRDDENTDNRVKLS